MEQLHKRKRGLCFGSFRWNHRFNRWRISSACEWSEPLIPTEENRFTTYSWS